MASLAMTLPPIEAWGTTGETNRQGCPLCDPQAACGAQAGRCRWQGASEAARRCEGLGMASPEHRAGRAIVSGVVVPRSSTSGPATDCPRFVPSPLIIVLRRGGGGRRAIRHTPWGQGRVHGSRPQIFQPKGRFCDLWELFDRGRGHYKSTAW